MGLRLTVDLFKGLDHAALHRELLRAAERLAKKVEVHLTTRGDIHSVSFSGYGNSKLCEAVGEATQVPWIEVRIQEESLWDYRLHEGARLVDQFSTLPEYWNDPDVHTPAEWREYVQKWVGNPALLASLWQIPVERIERYYRHWGMVIDPEDSGTYSYAMEGKAYPSDAHGYGQCRQMLDFYDVLFPRPAPGGQEEIVERFSL